MISNEDGDMDGIAAWLGTCFIFLGVMQIAKLHDAHRKYQGELIAELRALRGSVDHLRELAVAARPSSPMPAVPRVRA